MDYEAPGEVYRAVLHVKGGEEDGKFSIIFKEK